MKAPPEDKGAANPASASTFSKGRRDHDDSPKAVSSAESTAIASSVNNPSLGTAQTLFTPEPLTDFKQVPMAMMSGSGHKAKGGKKGQSSVESRLDYACESMGLVKT